MRNAITARRLLRSACFVLITTLACRGEPAADLVLTGGRVITMDPELDAVPAIACHNGRILAVGSEDEIAACIGGDTKVVKLNGLTVIPGFIEGHGHFVGLGQSKMILDLTTANNWLDVVEAVGAAAEHTRRGEWIIGRGWHQSKWSQQPQPNVGGYVGKQRTTDIVHRVTSRDCSIGGRA